MGIEGIGLFICETVGESIGIHCICSFNVCGICSNVSFISDICNLYYPFFLVVMLINFIDLSRKPVFDFVHLPDGFPLFTDSGSNFHYLFCLYLFSSFWSLVLASRGGCLQLAHSCASCSLVRLLRYKPQEKLFSCPSS